MDGWYPREKEKLKKLVEKLLESASAKQTERNFSVNGIIVPHAGYAFSGRIAGKAFSLLKNSLSKNSEELKGKIAVVLGANHYLPVRGAFSHNKNYWQTPLGKIKVEKSCFDKLDISGEHSIDNQVPFLQAIGFKKILPLMISEITSNEAREIAEKISKIEGIYVFSTDLSHFLDYASAKAKDEKTIRNIENLNKDYLLNEKNAACGVFPLLVLIELCKLKKWKPQLIEYKNSGDITGDKSAVVGYASFVF